MRCSSAATSRTAPTPAPTSASASCSRRSRCPCTCCRATTTTARRCAPGSPATPSRARPARRSGTRCAAATCGSSSATRPFPAAPTAAPPPTRRRGWGGGGPPRYALRCGDVRLVVCDTPVPGRDDGRLDADSLAWLEGELAAEPAVPTIVAMHHAPLLTGIGAMDAIGLPEADRSGLAGLLRRSPQVRRVVAGHVHRACFGLLGPCGVFACPSTHLQVRWDPSGPRIVLDSAPPSYGLHTVLAGGDVVTLVQPVASGAAG